MSSVLLRSHVLAIGREESIEFERVVSRLIQRLRKTERIVSGLIHT